MKKTMFHQMFRVMLVLIALAVLVMPAQPVAAQEVAPTGPDAAVVFLTPELSAWGSAVALRAGWLGLAIMFDLLLGVIAAIRAKNFDWARIADFLSTYGAKAVGWLALEVLTLMPVDLRGLSGFADGLATGGYALLLLSAVGSVLGHVSALGMLPVEIPGIQTKKLG
jgi:hypothetical protein